MNGLANIFSSFADYIALTYSVSIAKLSDLDF